MESVGGEAQEASWSRGRRSEGAGCPYEELFKTRVKVADLLRSPLLLLYFLFPFSCPHHTLLPAFLAVPLSKLIVGIGFRLKKKPCRSHRSLSLSKVSRIIDCFARARFPSPCRCPAVALFLLRERDVSWLRLSVLSFRKNASMFCVISA